MCGHSVLWTYQGEGSTLWATGSRPASASEEGAPGPMVAVAASLASVASSESFFPFLNDGTSLRPNGSVLGLPDGSVVKNPPANAGDVNSILGSVRSPGERNGSPLQYSYLGNLMVREAWWATVCGVARNWTGLSMHTWHSAALY